MFNKCSVINFISGLFGKESEKDISRIEKLQKNQILLLKHALRFPNVKRVVYSTCSIYEEENEAVVEQVMEKVSKYFRFTKIFPHWKGSRGIDKYPNANNFLRTLTDSDLTKSFFVACFERMDEVTDKADKECDVTASQEIDQLKENKKKKKKTRHSETETVSEAENMTLNADLSELVKRKNVKSETDQEEATTNFESVIENMDNERVNVLAAQKTNDASDNTKKKKKKSKKRKHAETDLELENLNMSEEKKDILAPSNVDSTESYKKKKKRKHSLTDSEFKNEDLSLDLTEQAKQKKIEEPSENLTDAVQKHSIENEGVEVLIQQETEAKEKSKKKKKKKRHSENE